MDDMSEPIDPLPRVPEESDRPAVERQTSARSSAAGDLSSTGVGVGGPTGTPIVAVFGGTQRNGRWRPGRRQTVVALFGGVALDLREAALPPDGLEMRVWAVFGGVKITLPEGMAVELVGGWSLFGGSSAKSIETVQARHAPVLRLHAVAVFGGVAAQEEPGRRS
jgi:hypothetical protein